MMINSRGKGVEAKQEAGAGDISVKLCRQPAAAATATSSRQWSAFRNPRIVRVSRTFGGKDRHSKVCTVRGLRDRRIRLSVPTVIQLYDLQDRLGLTQPSKVIDWLIDATKDDIDKLPPLQLPPGFAQFHQPMLPSQFDHLGSGSAQARNAGTFFDMNMGFHSFGVDHSCLRSRNNKEVDESMMEKGKWVKTDDQEGVCNNNNDHYNSLGSQVLAQNFFPLATTNTNPSSSLPNSFLNDNNSNIPFNPYFHWDASNLSLSQFGSQGFVSQPENNSALTAPTSQLFFCPPTTIPSFFQPFPPHVESTTTTTTPMEISANHFVSSSPTIMSTPMKHFSLNVNQGHPHDLS